MRTGARRRLRFLRRQLVFARRIARALDRARLFHAARRRESLLGVGSSVFHPESSRVARMAAGGRHGLAQSLFQVGGNVGQALGPLAAALVVVRWGQSSLAFFALLALVSGAILWNVGVWYKHHGLARLEAGASRKSALAALPPGSVRRGISVLLVLVFSKYVYLASLSSYFTFYLIRRFGLSVRDAQLELFAFAARGRGRHDPRRPVRRPHRPQARHLVLDPRHPALHAAAALRELVLDRPARGNDRTDLASAFPAIIVFAQELVPGKVGMVSGLFFGLAFGIGRYRRGSAGRTRGCLGHRARLRALCSYLPVFGLFAGLLPNIEQGRHQH
jgi:MFS transporter, FSR family, fosmidomycin resistance protein